MMTVYDISYRQSSDQVRKLRDRLEVTTINDPSDTAVDDEIPILGETFAVELANSHYLTDSENLDFLEDRDAVTAWFRSAPAAADIVVPSRLTADAVASLREIRDATRTLLAAIADAHATVDGASDATGWVEPSAVLHRATQRASAHLALDVDANGKGSWVMHYVGTDADTMLATVAGQCILFLGGADASRVRRCDRPACPMLFVQRHRRRRFCHESCAHSVRQARYYRAMRARP